MALLDSLAGSTKEKRTMLYFKENGHFKFQKVEVEDTFLLEKKNGRVRRAWEDLRRLRIPFPGWKGIPRDEITLAHSRDVIYDPFELLKSNPTERLSRNFTVAKAKAPFKEVADSWIGEITRTQQYKRQEESSKRMAQSTQMILLAIPAVLMGLGVFIFIVVNAYK